MTALADLLDAAASGQSDGVGTDGREVDERLLDHEIRYWETAAERLAVGVRQEYLSEPLAAAVLCGADDDREADAVLGGVPVVADRSTETRYAVRDWSAALYPSARGGTWGTVRPDRLAEYFVGRRLRHQPDLADHLLNRNTLSGRQTTHLLTVYARAAAHPAHLGHLDSHLADLCLRHRNVLPAVLDTRARPLPRRPRLTADGAAGHSQSRRLKTTYRLVHTTAMRRTAKGYPNAQCSSGMWSKFMP
jgi:hypothetical protein